MNILEENMIKYLHLGDRQNINMKTGKPIHSSPLSFEGKFWHTITHQPQKTRCLDLRGNVFLKSDSHSLEM